MAESLGVGSKTAAAKVVIQSVEVTPLARSLTHTSKASGDNVDSVAAGVDDEELFTGVDTVAENPKNNQMLVEVTPLTRSLAHTSNADGDNIDSFDGVDEDEETFAGVGSVAIPSNTNTNKLAHTSQAGW